jgi:hypothetical protein
MFAWVHGCTMGVPAEIEDIEAYPKWFWGFVCALEEVRREDECEMQDVQ